METPTYGVREAKSGSGGNGKSGVKGSRDMSVIFKLVAFQSSSIKMKFSKGCEDKMRIAQRGLPSSTRLRSQAAQQEIGSE